MPNNALTRGTLALCCLAAPIATHGQTPSSAVTPPRGSAARQAVLDALRASLGIKSLFEVYHLRVAGRWAYVRCNEVVFVEGETQETDLTVAALLERRGERWKVVERWTLPTDDKEPFAQFVRRVQARQRDAKIPAALFPPDY